ncbi:hypothetical protein FO519_002944 [Halicephalobus sp. NKZ332]|nr:hypothetical protein FO519_002944 [Halicephalobus sp. NKZ332]
MDDEERKRICRNINSVLEDWEERNKYEHEPFLTPDQLILAYFAFFEKEETLIAEVGKYGFRNLLEMITHMDPAMVARNGLITYSKRYMSKEFASRQVWKKEHQKNIEKRQKKGKRYPAPPRDPCIAEFQAEAEQFARTTPPVQSGIANILFLPPPQVTGVFFNPVHKKSDFFSTVT